MMTASLRYIKSSSYDSFNYASSHTLGFGGVE